MRTNLFIALAILALLATACTEDSDLVDPETLNVWENFTTSDGLISNTVQVVFEDSDNNIWLGSQEGVMIYEDGDFKDFPSINPLIGSVNSIVEDLNGDIYIGSIDGLGLYDGNEWFFFNFFGGSTLGIYALHIDNSGNLWMGTTFFGILVFEDITESPVQFFDDNCSECNDVNVFLPDPNGDLWIGTDGNLQRFDGSGFDRFTTADGLPDNEVTALSFDKWGFLWVGTFFGETATILEDGQFRAISLNNGSAANPILDMVQVQDGDLWLGHIEGIYTYDGAVVRLNSDPEGPGFAGIFSLIQHTDGDIWVGTLNEGVWRFTP